MTRFYICRRLSTFPVFVNFLLAANSKDMICEMLSYISRVNWKHTIKHIYLTCIMFLLTQHILSTLIANKEGGIDK